MMYKFTGRSEKALELAGELAAEFGHNYIGTEHILYGLIREGSGVASQVLNSQEITAEKIAEEIETLIGKGEEIIDESTIGFTPRSKRVIENAFMEAEGKCTCPSGLPYCMCGAKKLGKVVTKKPILPTEEEMKNNSRSKSAKLRIFEKI